MQMAKRAFAELKNGDVVNLGIGIPTLVADLIKPEDGIILHTENGMLGVGPAPEDGGGAMDYPVNAGKILLRHSRVVAILIVQIPLR
jgi:3-oxoacid CoA-transferase